MFLWYIYSAIECNDLEAIANGSISYMEDSRARYELGTIATHHCDYHYFLEGKEERTCVQDDQIDTTGVWNGTAPTCERMYWFFVVYLSITRTLTFQLYHLTLTWTWWELMWILLILEGKLKFCAFLREISREMLSGCMMETKFSTKVCLLHWAIISVIDYWI